MHPLLRGSRLQLIRLASGLILFLFVVTHLINHALGLFSVDAMEMFQTARMVVTRSLLGTVLLASAAVVHIGLACYRLIERRSLAMPWIEALQIATGVLIPVLLLDHLIATRFANALFGTRDYYHTVLAFYWFDNRAMQIALMITAWCHVMVGLHLWLRMTKGYRTIAPLLLIAAVLLPVLALLGVIVGAREVRSAVNTAAALDALKTANAWPDGARAMMLASIKAYGFGILAALAAGVIGYHVWRTTAQAVLPTVAVTYRNGPTIFAPIGGTLLEMSRQFAVPHASVCGGRARCSTCRVHVEQGLKSLAPPNFAEATTLGAINASPSVRLACQIRPQSALLVTRLVNPTTHPAATLRSSAPEAAGVERTLAVLFIDVRQFTARAENKLPYDVVFLLNRFFYTVGNAIHAHGGTIANYTGDGLLAVFGRETSPEVGCRSALAATAAIEKSLARLNRALVREHETPLEVGMGLHAGPMVLGQIGHPDNAVLTVIGSVVNASARLEALCKDFECRLVVSRDVLEMALVDLGDLQTVQTTIRGLSAPIDVVKVQDVRRLARR